MRWIFRLLLFAALAVFTAHAQTANTPASSDGGQPDAAKLLEESKQRYADAKYYHIEVVEEESSKSDYSHSWSKYMTTAVMAPENRYRFETRGPSRWWMQVSDGKTEWIYRVGVQEYTKQDTPATGPTEFKDVASLYSSSSSLRDAVKDRIVYEQAALATAQKTVKTLVSLLDRMGSATYLRDETLVFEDKEVPCYVIESVRKSGPSSAQSTYQQLLWIDKQTRLIRRSETHSGGRSLNMPDEPFVHDSTANYTVMNLDPSQPDSLFALTLPEKAKLVTKFEYHGYSPVGKILAGTAAPSVNLHAADGSTVTLDSFHGKPVLIDFWATWCGPCMKSLPAVEKLYRDAADKGLVLLSIDEDHDAKKATDFWAKHKEPWPDFHDDNWETEHAFGNSAIPYFVLIDPSGKITFTHTGEGDSTDSLLRAAIAKLGSQFASLAGDTKATVVDRQQAANEKPAPAEMPAIK